MKRKRQQTVKEDFVTWSDVDLDVALGEFTDVEQRFSDDNSESDTDSVDNEHDHPDDRVYVDIDTAESGKDENSIEGKPTFSANVFKI